MKRYLLSASALLLALVFVAFSPQKKTIQTATEDYYWYNVEPSTLKTVGPKIDDDQFTKAAMINEYTDCDDTSEDLCFFGSENPSVPNNSTVPTENNDVLIRVRD